MDVHGTEIVAIFPTVEGGYLLEWEDGLEVEIRRTADQAMGRRRRTTAGEASGGDSPGGGPRYHTHRSHEHLIARREGRRVPRRRRPERVALFPWDALHPSPLPLDEG